MPPLKFSRPPATLTPPELTMTLPALAVSTPLLEIEIPAAVSELPDATTVAVVVPAQCRRHAAGVIVLGLVPGFGLLRTCSMPFEALQQFEGS